MSFDIKKTYDVVNYTQHFVAIPITMHEHERFEASISGKPTVLPLTGEQIKYANGRSSAFKSGLLRFRESEQADIYEALRISNWKNILNEQEIIEVLSGKDYKKLQTIIDTRELGYISFVRGLLIRLINSGNTDITTHVITVVNQRYEELLEGKLATSIQVVPTKPKSAKSEESKKIDELEKQLEALMKLMEDTQAKPQEKEVLKTIENPKPKEEPKKKAEKPKTKKK